jgi:hypothetical protein
LSRLLSSNHSAVQECKNYEKTTDSTNHDCLPYG